MIWLFLFTFPIRYFEMIAPVKSVRKNFIIRILMERYIDRSRVSFLRSYHIDIDKKKNLYIFHSRFITFYFRASFYSITFVVTLILILTNYFIFSLFVSSHFISCLFYVCHQRFSNSLHYTNTTFPHVLFFLTFYFIFSLNFIT